MHRYASPRALAIATAFAVMVAASPIDWPMSLPLPLGSSIASAATAECQDGWREIKLPIESGADFILAVVPDDRGPRWLLGGNHQKGPLVFRKDSGAWARVAVPRVYAAGFTGGAPIADGTLAVSGYRNSPVVGTTAKVVAGSMVSDKLHGGSSTLTDTADTKGGTWAVGARNDGSRLRATALRKRGGGWKRLDPPTSGELALTAVDATATGSVWAVGWWQRSGKWMRPYIARRTASGWKQVTPGAVGAGEAVLTDVHFDADDRGWATGYHLPKGSGRYLPLLMKWDGQRWSNVDVPFADGRSLIARAVATDDEGTIHLAGAQLAAGDREVRGFTATRSGGTWQFRVLDTPSGLPSELRSLAAGPESVVAGGSVGSTTFAMESCLVELSGSKRKVSVSRVKQRRDAGLDADHPEDVAEQEARTVEPAGAKPPGFGAPKAPTGWRVKDVASGFGLPARTSTWGGLVHDFDGNGWRDILISRHLGLPQLWLASASGLARGPGAAFTGVDRHGCDAADIDKNGLADVFCTVGRVHGTATGRHELSMNVAGPAPSVARGSAGAVDPLGRGRQVTFIDYDDDGDDDLYITNANRRVDGLPRGNRFYRNVGGRFIPAPQVGLDRAVGGRCLWSGDIDRDGDEDLINCVTEPLDGRSRGIRLYRNDGGRLVDRTVKRGIKSIGDIDVAVADVTGDKRPDLIQLTPTRLRVSKQTDAGFKVIYQASTSDAVAVAVGDVNKDKRADIYVQRGGNGVNKRDFLLLNKQNGRKFKPMKIPQTSEGDADDVLAIDFDRNGRTDFLVLNGDQEPGPVMLLSILPD